MENDKNTVEISKDKSKGFFRRILDKIDKKMEEKSKDQGCCNKSEKGSSCC